MTYLFYYHISFKHIERKMRKMFKTEDTANEIILLPEQK